MSIQRCCPPAKVDATDRVGDAALFKALADPHRLAMLATLARADGDVCVCDFTGALPLAEPAKKLADYALFITKEPGLELALDLDLNAVAGRGEHFGIVVDSAEAVDAQIARL